MDTRLKVLKVVLDRLAATNVGTLEERKAAQKAVYLAQVAGVDLGYRYGWYVLGPYCTTLTEDYYSLSAQAADDPSATDGVRLKADVEKTLRDLKPLLLSPVEDLNRADWLELLASYHYLRTVSRMPDGEATKTLKEHERKKRLAPFVSQAKLALARSGLLST